MKTPSLDRHKELSFNVTPLIDVVFLLIIFFLVSTHVVQSEVHAEADIPDSENYKKDDKESPRRIVITVQKDGVYMVKKQPWTMAKITAAIKEGAGDAPEGYAVRIRMDKEALYETIEPIIKTCAKSGVRRIELAVRPK